MALVLLRESSDYKNKQIRCTKFFGSTDWCLRARGRTCDWDWKGDQNGLFYALLVQQLNLAHFETSHAARVADRQKWNRDSDETHPCERCIFLTASLKRCTKAGICDTSAPRMRRRSSSTAMEIDRGFSFEFSFVIRSSKCILWMRAFIWFTLRSGEKL